MIAQFGAWIAAKLALLAGFVLEWLGPAGLIAVGVVLLSVLVAFLIHRAGQELSAKGDDGPLERGRAPRARRGTVRTGRNLRPHIQAPG